MPNPFAAIADAIAPPRLGRPFRTLLASAIITNAGDGAILAAGPLLVASQTGDPFLVSLAALCEWLPPLVLGSFAGVIVDRVDRRRLLVLVNLARAVVLAVLAGTIVTNAVSIAVVLAALLVLATGETFADVASQSLTPRLVARDGLGLANARLQGAYLLTNQLVAPPIGAFLFAAGMAIPFAADAAAYVLGAIVLARLAVSSTRPAGADQEVEAGPAAAWRSVRRELAEGFRWLLAHPPMRTLALTVIAFNVTYGATLAVFVLYARDRLGLDSVGFGVLTTASAIGGIIGTVAYGRLERRFSLADLMRAGLVIETITHLVLATTRSPEVAFAALVVFGAHEVVWWTTSTTVRQRAVPDALMGRVAGISGAGLTGGLVVGAPIGGILAGAFGLAAPFWFGFIGSAVLVTVLWRAFGQIAHTGDAPVPA
jgi:predicted MFS family arabinose efflux permease